MENRYKLILSTKRSYREAELSAEQSKKVIGTGLESDIRFREEDFFEPFVFTAVLDQDRCQLECGENVYFSAGDARKLMLSELTPGGEITVKYRESGVEVMRLHFMVDFDYYPHTYDRRIDLSGIQEIRLGDRAGAQIRLGADRAADCSVLIQKNGSQYVLRPEHTDDTVRLNGNALKYPAALKQLDFIAVGPYSFCFQNGGLYTDSNSDIVYNGVTWTDEKESVSRHEYPKFNRSTRIHEQLPEEKIEILDPPNKPKKPKANWAMRLLPAIAMIGVVVLLRGFMSTSNITYILLSVCTMGIGVATSVATIITEKKDYKEESAKREEKYRRYIENKRKTIEEARAEETRILENRYISASRELDQIEAFLPELFERSDDDDDFLEFRLGTGMRKAYREVTFRKQERIEADDELADIPEKLTEEYEMLKDAPVTLKLGETGRVGVTGPQDALVHILKLMTLDLASRHYYTDIQLVYSISEEDTGRFAWLRMLPHVQNDVLGRRNIICDDESRNIILEYLYKEILARGQDNRKPHIIVFVYRDNGIRRHPVSALMQEAKDKGITFVYFDEYSEYLPKSCEYLIRMQDLLHGELIDCSGSRKPQSFTASVLEDGVLARAMKKLAPVYCEEISLESTLTKNITFFELMNIYGPEDIDLAENWGASCVYRSMAAPIGVKSKNQIVYLDLNEKHHGPHGLVAGTTGSGKSELLQAYILSMSLLFHPYDVSFMIIDFKGGGMVNQFRDLPHLAGAITNIDGKAINRSLLSIRAELKKRQELFASCGVNHIDAYIRLYKQGIAKVPLPHLILIVDEFAELKAEQPEFMKELISTARIGRSLGVHLILATQKPSGVVDPQIWSNSRFKLCLKVQTREDSNEVLKSPLAAEITEPGRAYLQVGNNEIFELFQSAYSGASARAEGVTAAKKFIISKVDFAGRRTKVYEQKPQMTDEQTQTQLESIVEYISGYCRKKQIPPLPFICLPPLPEILTTEDWEEPCSVGNGLYACAGLYDDPSHQKQSRLMLDVTRENTMIIGSAGNGKTNLLQAIVRSLTSRYTPDELNLYILDFGSMVFRNYELLHHVGGVVCSYEEEKCRSLFRMLAQEMELRKQKLAEAGVSSYASYLESGKSDLPQIVVLIDNLTAMREMYLLDNDFLLPVCRDGLAVGISFVIANSQTSGIGYKYLSNFESRIALYCNDSTEYGAMFDGCRLRPDNLPGRCLISKDKTIYEAQTYLAFSGEKEVERVGKIQDYVRMQNECYPDSFAKPIPEVPKELTPNVLKRKFRCASDPKHLILGVDYETIEPVSFGLADQSVLAVSGHTDRGRADFIASLCCVLGKMQADLYIMDDRAQSLGRYKELPSVRLYSSSPEDIGEMMEDMEATVEEQYTPGSEDSAVPAVLLINDRNAAAYISEDRELLECYKRLINKCRSADACVILGDVDNVSINYNSPEVLKMLKENRQFLVFANAGDIKLADLVSSYVRRNAKPLEKNDAFWISGTEVCRMKAMQPDASSV